MTQSVFTHPENLWTKRLSHREIEDVVNLDLYYALEQQNINAIRACLGFLKKKQLDDDTLKSVYHQFAAAEDFKANTWLSVLRIFHLYDKQYGFAGEWVKHTPSAAHKLQEILQENNLNEEKTKIQTLVLRYSLATPHIENLVQSISPIEREKVAEQLLQFAVTQWKMSSHSPWSAQTAEDVCTAFPQYSRAVFLKIAATACALEHVNALYANPNINRTEYFSSLQNAGNEGVTSEMLSLWALDSSMTFEHRLDMVIKDLERLFQAAPSEEQKIYLDRLNGSFYTNILKMSPVLESAAQNLQLKRHITGDWSNQEERARKI